MAMNFGWHDPRGLYNAERDEYQPLPLAQQNSLSQMQAAQLQQKYAMAQAQAQNAYAQRQATRPEVATLGQHDLTQPPCYTFDELNDEGSVYNMKLQVAVDLAINTFGSGWFKDETTAEALDENQAFWLKVMHKLFKNQRLLHERYRSVERDEYRMAWKILDTGHENN